MKIGLMSDTHSFLDEKVFHHFRDVDEIWHAGDFGTVELADRLAAFKPLRGVYGNIDSQALRARFGEKLVFDTEGVKVFMQHIGGYPSRYAPSVRAALMVEKPNLFISGHSHILKIMPDKALNLLHINPGACGQEGWHKVKTLVRFEIQNATIQQVEVIEIGLRGGIIK